MREREGGGTTLCVKRKERKEKKEREREGSTLCVKRKGKERKRGRKRKKYCKAVILKPYDCVCVCMYVYVLQTHSTGIHN